MSGKIKIKTTFPDGYVLEYTQEAGFHLINFVFDSKDYKNQIKKLDDEFLDSCECSNKNKILNILKAAIVEVGSDTADSDDWNTIANDFSDCASYELDSYDNDEYDEEEN